MRKYNNFYNFSFRTASVNLGDRRWFAHFKIEGDFSRLLPYLQAISDQGVYYESPEAIEFRLDDIRCSLYPPNIVVSRLFYERKQALAFARRLIDYLNELEFRKFQIKPNYKKTSRLQILEIMRLLPLTNCGACGFRTCMALAGAVSRRKAVLSTCRHFPEPVDAKLLFVVKGRRSETIRKIEVDADLAGVAISKINNASQSVSEACAELNDKTKPSKALTGNHAGIVSPLSRREAEVLRLISGGLTNKEIAWRLKITPDTVKSHVVHIFNKLGVNDRTQAAVRAVQNQLI